MNNKNAVIVNPDIHGRTFWKQNLNTDNITIFLGDYLDPYPFEHITHETAIENFKEIIEYKKQNEDKVILLLGNHDYPYLEETYYYLSRYHSRHAEYLHKPIHKLYEENKTLFQLAYTYNDILFTHAGVNKTWLTEQLHLSDIVTPQETETEINKLFNNPTKENMEKLHMVSWLRGGFDNYSSCIWQDVHEMTEFETQFKQIFGHTLQGHFTLDNTVVYDPPIITDKYMMLDNTKQYIVDTQNFTAERKG